MNMQEAVQHAISMCANGINSIARRTGKDGDIVTLYFEKTSDNEFEYGSDTVSYDMHTTCPSCGRHYTVPVPSQISVDDILAEDWVTEEW